MRDTRVVEFYLAENQLSVAERFTCIVMQRYARNQVFVELLVAVATR
jgi:hypothetical protein